MKRAFVIGHPIAHSRSPLIHRFWLDEYGIAGDYVKEPVSPQHAPGFFASLADRGFVGGNVTIPHKATAFAACGQVTAVAARLQAVNTLWFERGILCGDNTDVHGFAANLDQGAPQWRHGRSALVLGAGGASRAVIQALLDARYGRIIVLNRTAERARELANHFGQSVKGDGLADLGPVLPEADLVINATSSGMAGEGAINTDWSRAKADAIVTDLVYVPLQTSFLADAASHGFRTVDGLGMLLHQAAPGFERWFGTRPVVSDELRRRVIRDIEG